VPDVPCRPQADLAEVEATAYHVAAFAQSFHVEWHGRDTDYAALFSTLGWWSGWKPWLQPLAPRGGAPRVERSEM
jgi:uncharacterized protein YbjT (DUF2867 family)